MKKKTGKGGGKVVAMKEGDVIEIGNIQFKILKTTANRKVTRVWVHAPSHVKIDHQQQAHAEAPETPSDLERTPD